MPGSTQSDDVVFEARVNGVARVDMNATLLDGWVGWPWFRVNRDDFPIGSDDPLASFFVESSFFVVFRGRIACFN